jgi:hypothetical protein
LPIEGRVGRQHACVRPPTEPRRRQCH